MQQFIPVNYTDLAPPVDLAPPHGIDNDFKQYLALNNPWGQVAIGGMMLPDIHLVKFEGQLHSNLHLQQRESQESNTVDTCIFLDGAVTSDFAGVKHRISMHKGQHNFVYRPEMHNDHYIQANTSLKIVHFSVDRLYYTQLLCDSEKWSAQLKEKLLNKEVVSGSVDDMMMSPQMLKIVHDIENCSLQGNLKRIVVEAKVLEFIALQLDQLVRRGGSTTPQKLSAKDLEAFHGLREFLQQTFTQDHSLRSLSRAFGLNEFKLKKGFKELFGSTVFEYLHDLKMEHARLLLNDTDAHVCEVSGRVGYKNANHFSTAFKKKFGFNPTQGRKCA